ncbi:MAG: nucleotidyl transferase AbiEii/AbiGii toxin family protein [Candidatus Omnitrophica bacterium]|nr:nucleotidyl transferase AbiEii/AbiGii toxin family protein [Candidatus Omnitrophota bacterium]
MTRQAEVVPVVLRTLLGRLAAIGATQDFYLAGGTGLALRLRHRRSVDLDFFSRTNRLAFEERRDLHARLRRLPDWVVVETKHGTLHGTVGRTRISFFHYDAPLLKPPVRWKAVRIASLEDIGVMKLGAIIGRGSRKDFVDLYVICRRIPLRRLLALGPRKFTRSRDFTLQALKALSYFQDAEREPAITMRPPVAWSEITAFFQREVRKLTGLGFKGRSRRSTSAKPRNLTVAMHEGV